MNYAEQLAEVHSRANTDHIANAIGNDPKEFKKIIQLIYTAEAPIPQRASWLLMVIARKHPELIKPYVVKLTDTIRDFKIDGIKRHILFALATQQIPEKQEGKTVDFCFEFILSPDAPVAVKVFSMEILSNLIKKYPDLKNELKAAIEDQLPKTTAAFHARARRILKIL